MPQVVKILYMLVVMANRKSAWPRFTILLRLNGETSCDEMPGKTVARLGVCSDVVIHSRLGECEVNSLFRCEEDRGDDHDLRDEACMSWWLL